jgi:hypothetical protein
VTGTAIVFSTTGVVLAATIQAFARRHVVTSRARVWTRFTARRDQREPLRAFFTIGCRSPCPESAPA